MWQLSRDDDATRKQIANGRRFVAALRSGRWKKCEGKLCIVNTATGEERVCFWGAATQFYMENVNNHGIVKSVVKIAHMGLPGHMHYVAYNGLVNDPVAKVVNWLGLDHYVGKLIGENDRQSTRRTFCDLANMAEEILDRKEKALDAKASETQDGPGCEADGR